VRELEQAQADNRRLRRLLGLRDTIPHEMVSAVVVGKDTTEFFASPTSRSIVLTQAFEPTCR
jgi:cell shape-determining protein MreC